MTTLPFFTNPLAPAKYVFESNRAGTLEHDAGVIAKEFYGAQTGQGEGATGQAYAIPVRDVNGKALSLNDIKWHVEAFLGYARQNKESFFQVSRLGCGPNLYSDEQMAALFFRAPPNVWLPGKWRLLVGTLERARLVVYGPPDLADMECITRGLHAKTSHWGGKFELITDHTTKVGQFAEEWMRAQNLPTTPFVPHSATFQDKASHMVRQQMVWYATHLIAFSDGKHEDTKDIISIARENGLRVGVIDCITTANSLEMLT